MSAALRLFCRGHSSAASYLQYYGATDKILRHPTRLIHARDRTKHKADSVCKLLVILLALAMLAGCASSNASAALKEYDLGVRYLSEGNYEEAVISFTKAIEIDEKYADAYLGRAQAYESLGTEDYLVNARQYYAADIYWEQGKAKQAEQILNDALASLGGDEMLSDKPAQLQGATSSGTSTGSESFPRTDTQYFYDGRYQVDGYDANGNWIKSTKYESNGFHSSYRTFEYDTVGNCIKENHFRVGDELYESLAFEYDNNRNCTKFYYYSG